MDLNELRLEIDKIDDQLVRLFTQRMEVSAKIADYKKEHGLPIFVPSREAEKLRDVTQKAGAEMEVYTSVLYSMLFELSRGYQSKRNATRTALYEQIITAVENTPKLIPKDVFVACSTDADAQMHLVCQKLFGSHTQMPFKNLDGILSAVQQGMCHFAIVCIDGNSKDLYDAIAAHGLYIVRSFRVNVGKQYMCLSKSLEIYPGADRSSIRMSLVDQPGALYKVFSRLYTLGINVLGLESRPIAADNFQRMFYFDLQTSVYSDEFVQLICELDDLCKDFSYLGSYVEVV